jgi:hypothetical protein
LAIVKQWGFTVNTDHFGMTCKNGQVGTYRSTARHEPFKLSCLTSRQIRKERVGRRIPGGPNAEEERCVSLP